MRCPAVVLQPPLNDQSTTPRFQQIVEHIKDKIEVELNAHDSLPSERALAEDYGVSRMTARRALEAIETEGLAYSEGRRGRFVSPLRLPYDISRVSFAADAENAGMDLEIKLIEAETVAANRQLAKSLQVEPGEPLYQYTRLFCTHGHSTFIETEYVIAKHFPGLLEHDLQQSTTKLLQRNYNSTAKSADVVIRMRSLQREEADLLGLTSLQIGIELEQITRDAWGQPFCFGRQIWRGEMAEFSVHAVANPNESN